MNLNDIPEPSEEDLKQVKCLVLAYNRMDENQDYNLKSSMRVIAHLIRQGKVLARDFQESARHNMQCWADFKGHEGLSKWGREILKAIKTFEEIE